MKKIYMVPVQKVINLDTTGALLDVSGNGMRTMGTTSDNDVHDADVKVQRNSWDEW